LRRPAERLTFPATEYLLEVILGPLFLLPRLLPDQFGQVPGEGHLGLPRLLAQLFLLIVGNVKM
jgi:hypothetical protein